MVPPTKAKVEKNADTAVMSFEGDITSTSEDAVLGEFKTLPGSTAKILLDFSKVPYVNSSGIGSGVGEGQITTGKPDYTQASRLRLELRHRMKLVARSLMVLGRALI